MWQTGGPPVLHRVAIPEAAHPACRKRRLLDTHQWQSALLVAGLLVIHEWIEMGAIFPLAENFN